MLSHKTFLKKTRRGKVIKVVREHYLRDDIGCGVKECNECYGEENGIAGPDLSPACLPRLPRRPTPSCSPSLHTSPHFLILDTNIVLDQIDILEESDNGMENVVILQTVLEEVRHRSSPVYKRLKDVIADAERRAFFVFVNEHHAETYVERKPGESANDRNDRAIRTAARWFGEHAVQKGGCDKDVGVVLLTDDVDNRNKAKKEGGIAGVYSVTDYVRSMSDNKMLADKLKVKDDNKENKSGSGGKRFLFPEHMSPAQINAGVKSKAILKGVFYLSRTNYLEGTVNCEGIEQPVLIQGLEQMNRAVDGDHVAVKLLEKKAWSAPAEIILDDDAGNADPGDTLEDGAKKLLDEAVKKNEDVQPTARVVGIVKRKWRQYCGMLVSNPGSSKTTTRHIFVPAEKKIPKIRIETRQADTLKGNRIVVAVDSWPRHSRYPQGHFVRILGKLGDKATENEVLLLEHDIPHSKFSEAVLDCLPSLPWDIKSADVAERVDCRHLDICSVDPPGCTDIDDALHARELDNGNLEVGVHIADVSHFIRPGTAIDKEAANRSTTVYLTDRRIDMVPELLSSNLCSLRGGVERFAFSCVWEITKDAEILSTKFHKSIIKSRAAMTYEMAQNRIDDPEDNDAVTLGLRRLLELSRILKRRRTENGALILASSEIRFNVDSETADPIDVQVKVARETNSMVEEFMLAANISAAKRIFEEFPDCAMLRRHPAPPPSNFDPLVKAGKQAGFEIIVETGKRLADSLNEAVDAKNPYFNTMLRMIATRCMMQAVYFASGSIEEPLFAHYGLACPIYTHFTSPIRRYADVIVHRLLAVSVDADVTYKELLDKKETQNIANNINYRHRMAQYASRSSVNLHTHIFFRNRKRDETGYILFVRQNAMQVLIPKYGLEGTLFLRTTTDKDDKDKENKVNFVFDEAVPSQTCGDVSFKLFMEVKVQMSLDSSNVQHEKLMLRLVEPKVEGFSVEPAEEEGEKAKDAGDESKVGVGKEAVKRSLAQEDGGGGKKKGKKMKKGK